MHTNPRRATPVFALVALAVAAGGYYFLNVATQPADLMVSGTVEATEVRLASEFGGRVVAVSVAEGQPVQAGQTIAEIDRSHSVGSARAGKERVRSPIDGVVLYRSVEPGEVVAPGAPLVTVADLSRMTLTVYVPEDRYGAIRLGQPYPVTVDSYPGQVFTAVVSHIADRAEFTPRNVQTSDSRRTTVFAIKLDLADTGGSLKPGMPADVRFEVD